MSADESSTGSDLHLEKSTGFDASPYADYDDPENTLTRRSSRLNDPRSLLSQWTSAATAKRAVTHPLTNKKTSPEALVTFEGPDDPYRPLNWSTRKKWMTVLLYGLTTMCSSWNTSIFSGVIVPLGKEYHVADVVSTLGTTLFLFGFGSVLVCLSTVCKSNTVRIGPLLWAPLSEVYGRKVAVFPPYFIGGCFTFATAASKDLSAIFITRFFAGFFSSAPVTNTGGVLGDMFTPAERATALAVYSMAVAGGPLVAPIVAGAITVSGVSWRWTEYVQTIDPQTSKVVLTQAPADHRYDDHGRPCSRSSLHRGVLPTNASCL